MTDFPGDRFARAGISPANIAQLAQQWSQLASVDQDAEALYIESLSDAEVGQITQFPVSDGAFPQPPAGPIISYELPPNP